IRYTTAFDIDSGALLSANQEVLVSGPGRIEFKAGRDIDLGASSGIASVGNTRNPALVGQGASIGLYAGFAPEADYAGFADSYLTAGSAQRATFDALNTDQQPGLLVDVFFDELRTSGVVAARNGDYRRGLAAVRSLFPDRARGGDIRLNFSKVSTLAGGDIDMLAPGGLINAGLASSVLNAKPASELGIVAQRAGAVNVFSEGDVEVNASRVFALGGDDITVWSSNGNIDAGRGAKSALSVPPPVVSYDSNGNLKVEFPPVVSGSGIRTASSDPAQEAGDVFLFAVNGVVNAGEAGIGGNNIVIAATAVIGAANIDVGG
ncbi:unnamed protein product, partial [Phaeothamnion confervicola]